MTECNSNNNNDNKLPSLTDHSIFYKRRQQNNYNQNEPQLDFEMEWDPDHKLYAPPKLEPSTFKLNINNNNNNIELMAIDEKQPIQQPQQPQPIQPTINNNDNKNQDQKDKQNVNKNNNNNNIDLNKVSLNDSISSNNNESDDDDDDNNNVRNLHQKVKRSSASYHQNHHHHHHHHQQISLQKPFFQRYISKNQYSPMLSPSILYNGNNHDYYRQQQQLLQQQQSLLTTPSPPTTITPLSTSKLPEILEGYLYLIVRVLLVFLLFFGIYITFNSILHDVNFKYKQYSAELSKQLEKCTKLYSDNKCSPLTRIPAMEQQCTEWELCMAKDPSTLPKSKILAEILSEVLDSFVSTMSYKTILFLISIIWMIIWIPNKLLDRSNNNSNNKKNRNNNNNSYHQSPQQPQQQLLSPNTTPTHSIFAKNLFTIEQTSSDRKNIENKLLSDWSK